MKADLFVRPSAPCGQCGASAHWSPVTRSFVHVESGVEACYAPPSVEEAPERPYVDPIRWAALLAAGVVCASRDGGVNAIL